MNQENAAVDWLDLSSAQDLEAQMVTTQLEFVREMDLGAGIALNEALRENIFMLLKENTYEYVTYFKIKGENSTGYAKQMFQK